MSRDRLIYRFKVTDVTATGVMVAKNQVDIGLMLRFMSFACN